MAVKNLQRIESGRQNLSLTTIERVCTALDVVPDMLFGSHEGRRSEAKGAVGTDHDAATRSGSLLQRLEGAGFPVREATSRGRLPANAVPVTTLRAAAGHFTGAARAVEILGYTMLPRRGPSPRGQFVAEILGRSMAPRIPSGSICLFEPPRPPPHAGRTFLVAHASLGDDALGGPYALKRIGATTKLRSGKTRVSLESVNPDYEPITVVVREGELQFVAELERVLVRGSA